MPSNRERKSAVVSTTLWVVCRLTCRFKFLVLAKSRPLPGFCLQALVGEIVLRLLVSSAATPPASLAAGAATEGAMGTVGAAGTRSATGFGGIGTAPRHIGCPAETAASGGGCVTKAFVESTASARKDPDSDAGAPADVAAPSARDSGKGKRSEPPLPRTILPGAGRCGPTDALLVLGADRAGALTAGAGGEGPVLATGRVAT